MRRFKKTLTRLRSPLPTSCHRMIRVYSDEAAKVSKSRPKTGKKTLDNDWTIKKQVLITMFINPLKTWRGGQNHTLRAEKTRRQALPATDELLFRSHLSPKNFHQTTAYRTLFSMPSTPFHRNVKFSLGVLSGSCGPNFHSTHEKKQYALYECENSSTSIT